MLQDSVAKLLFRLSLPTTTGMIVYSLFSLIDTFFVAKLGALIRSYFAQGGHHVQFNVVDNATLLAARENPEDYRDLMVRVAGYSDYFNDLHENFKQEIIDRTENGSF